MKNLLLLLTLLVFVYAFTFDSQFKNCTLEGRITDTKTSEGMIAAQVTLLRKGETIAGTTTDFDGNYVFTNINEGTYDLEVNYLGYQSLLHKGLILKSESVNKLDLQIREANELLECVVIKAYKAPLIEQDNTTQGKTVTAEDIRSLPTKSITTIAATSAGISTSDDDSNISIRGSRSNATNYYVDGIRVSQSSIPASEIDLVTEYERVTPGYTHNEEYGSIVENKFINPKDEALSTFSIDVDRAGYSNMRRFIDNGSLPPKDAIRIEEMINYFNYSYSEPKGDDPISLNSTLTDCPWNDQHQLLHIGLKGKEIDKKDLPASNLVFLIDVSGSMSSANKLPLVKASFKMLLNNLRDGDRVAIVTYAGSAGVALQSTSIKEKDKILRVIESLGAGGSTAGAQGIKTAYNIAEENFIKKGNNRVILTTDGDFNVGINSAEDLESLIEKKRKNGVFLSVLGYGMGNYKDHKMQTLADKGNGNHAYIDNIQEARKVLVTEFAGTLFTIAKDVKLQIEFNPSHVKAYRLIGYENRLLAKEDFNDDTKDAGELGAGHVVTAIYEIVKVGSKSNVIGSVDQLKYQTQEKEKESINHYGDELATVKFRCKKPDGKKSERVVDVIPTEKRDFKKCNDDIRFSVCVAQFGMLLRNSKHLTNGTIDQVIENASDAKGEDEEGYRSEFVRLVKSVKDMDTELYSSRQ